MSAPGKWIRSKHRRSEWYTALTLVTPPLIAIILIYLATRWGDKDIPKGPALKPQRLTPQRTLILNRSPNMVQDSALGAFSERQLGTLVERMEAASSVLGTNSEIAQVLGQPLAQTPTESGIRNEHAELPELDKSVLVSDLKTPDGLALDPRNGNLYVSEEEANRIVMYTPRGKRRVVLDDNDSIPDDSGFRRVRHPPLQSPEGLAMDAEGGLYVVEDRPGGRLIRLQCDENGKMQNGELIKLPGQWTPFAWEAIAVSPRGELLLGGSSAEGQMKEGATLFQGALLYRDNQKQWWALSMRPASGISAVSFSADGEFAIYTDEFSGTIGWMDLTSRSIKEGASSYTAKSPEGLAVLPDGRLIVAEEGGQLILVDPRVDSPLTLMRGLGSIESLVWDDAHNRLLVSADSQGVVMALPADAPWPASENAMAAAPVISEGAVRHIPSVIPEFLIPMLDLGLGSSTNQTIQDTFLEITRRLPIMAADSQTTLIYGTEEVSDPVVQVVFVAVAPSAIMNDDLSQEFSVSAIILRTRSGQVYRSKLTRMAVLAGNVVSGRFNNLGTFDLPIPFAYQALVSPRGHAIIHFAGLGQSPDISIALNPSKPEESYMVISHMTGVIEQYRLERAPDGSLDNWVVCLPPRRADAWTSLQGSAPTPVPGG